MSRRTKEEANETRKRILASALSLFVKKGYEHTTFTDVAVRLKMTKGAVYWHFKSKESLLIALVNEMLEKFRRQIGEPIPRDKLTFPAFAEMMITNAERIVEDPKGAAFFLLLQTQVKWRADSMEATREKLLSSESWGPYHAFVQAIENDIAAGRVRPEVSAVSVATVSMAVWNGLVRSKIEKFLQCDLRTTLKNTYEAMWKSIEVSSEK